MRAGEVGGKDLLLSANDVVMDDPTSSTAFAGHFPSATVGDPPSLASCCHLPTGLSSVVGRRDSHSILASARTGALTVAPSLSNVTEYDHGQAELAILAGKWPGCPTRSC